jgi:hypothetical protein
LYVIKAENKKRKDIDTRQFFLIGPRIALTRDSFWEAANHNVHSMTTDPIGDAMAEFWV